MRGLQLGSLFAVLTVLLLTHSVLEGGATKVKVGDKLPEIKGTDDQGKPWNSNDIVGKKILVLYFFPADLTGGCTKQACGFRDDLDALHGKDIEIVGVSGDTVENHKVFKKVHMLNFTLLADEKGEIGKKLGVPFAEGSKTFAFKGSDGFAAATLVRGGDYKRQTIVVDKTGTVVAFDSIADAGGDSKRVLELVKKLDKK